MPVKLNTNQTNDIPVRDMKDGQIGVITSWVESHYIGNIVQRYRTHLISVSMSSDFGWHDAFSSQSINHPNFRVRLLEPGETIEILSN